MEGQRLEPEVEPEAPLIGDAQVAVQFLRALFADTDTILFRPIETWSESGRKRSRVDYRNTCYRVASVASLEQTLPQLLDVAASERLNLFFGACPRIDGRGRFDLAWQIRTVRAIWTDIDHVTVEAARDRVASSVLPEPSVVVNSGHGVHLYWLLDEPYQVDDVAAPPPVETEWIVQLKGARKPRKFVVEDDERIYLDAHRYMFRLSGKAQHFQDVLSGVAQALGGDHTTDLARLLRIPGSLNRKDQRNGREPTETQLVACDATRRYPLEVFESLKSESP